MHAAGPSTGTSRYLVQTTDVIQDMRVNVSNEHFPNNIIWYKERFLSDNEIVENLVHNPTSTVQWTIHRPIRGWYIRLRSPTFPPGVFIPLTPVPSSSPLHTDAAISFNTRTNMAAAPSLAYIQEQRSSLGEMKEDRADAPEDEEDVAASGLKGGLPTSESQFTLDSEDEGTSNESKAQSSTSSLHSYPPTPTMNSPRTSISSYTARPPRISTSSIPSKSNGKRRAADPLVPSTQITQFLLAPHDPLADSNHHQQQQEHYESLFSRALSLLKSHRPRSSNSFILSRVIPPNSVLGQSTPSQSSSSLPPPPYASNVSLSSSNPASSTTHILPSSSTAPSPSSPFSPFSPFSPVQPTTQGPQYLSQHTYPTTPTLHTTPLLTFHDHTPLLTVRSLTGILELDKNEERTLGVDTSFWVAVALCYLEFLEERESYLAALSD